MQGAREGGPVHHSQWGEWVRQGGLQYTIAFVHYHRGLLKIFY